MEFKHKPVLFDESVASLNIGNGKIIVDATAGGGGHSMEILSKLQGGTLIAIDQDPQAIEHLSKKFQPFENVHLVNDNFENLAAILADLGINKVDGILFDLGVSSHQLDSADRGFSFHQDAPLDMRMSSKGLSAKDVVNTYSQHELADIIYKYGEEKYSRSIAKNIVLARQKKPIETTFELVEIIRNSMPARALRTSHPARRTFQAIRIEVNGELNKLSVALEAAFDSLNSGGRLSVITFHSLEDRMVKERFNSWVNVCTCPKEFPICVCGNKPKGVLPFKSKSASDMELLENKRARSARLRCFEKF